MGGVPLLSFSRPTLFAHPLVFTLCAKVGSSESSRNEMGDGRRQIWELIETERMGGLLLDGSVLYQINDTKILKMPKNPCP